MIYSEKLQINHLYNLPALFLVSLLIFGGCEGGSSNESVDSDDIAGQVTGPNGPEAGVWVIAETFDLPTRYAKIVVTNDDGRYLLPDLPDANFSIWVRGYGLIDSEKVQSKPGTNIDLTAVEAPDQQAAAEYYPAGYWFSLLDVPDKSNFPGTGPVGKIT